MATKICTKCGVEKTLVHFYKLAEGRTSPDGHQAKCKECCKAYLLGRYYLRENKTPVAYRPKLKAGDYSHKAVMLNVESVNRCLEIVRNAD